MTTRELTIHLRNPSQHPNQLRLVESIFKRIIAKAGRRGGKTVGVAIKAVKAFLKGRRVLYVAPTTEQTDKFWYEVKRALKEAVDAGIYKQNDSEQFIEKPGTENRIKAKTAWNANMLRGDYADLLLLDEFQLMAEDVWDEVGAPMLLDNNGDAVFIFTPPSLKSAGISKARDPRHASKLFKTAQADKTGLWETIHFTSFDNPFISREGLALVTSDMSLDSYRREILAQDDEIETSWLVHSKFNESLCKIKRFDIPKNWDVFSGHDFGSANPAALFLARVKLPLPSGAPAYMRLNDLVAFREYAPGAGFSTSQHVARFQEFVKDYHVIKSIGGNQTTEDEIRQGYAAHGWLIQAPIIERVNAQLDRVIALEELNKIYVFEDLFMTLSQLANCMWELDKDNKPINKVSEEAKYHLLACLRYIGSDFTPETIVTGKPQVAVRYGIRR
jgi:hypothetical protein